MTLMLSKIIQIKEITFLIHNNNNNNNNSSNFKILLIIIKNFFKNNDICIYVRIHKYTHLNIYMS